MPTIVMRATYEEIPADAENAEEHGFTDPRNPWGGFDAIKPDDVIGEVFTAWLVDNADSITFTSPWEAAEFVVEFPGAVWDFAPDCDAMPKDDHYRTVTLHVVEHAPVVLALATTIQALRSRRVSN